MEDILKEFLEKVCPTCKSECKRGITFIKNGNKEVKCKCVDYVKDETKIDKTEKALYVTAKKSKPVMKDLV